MNKIQKIVEENVFYLIILTFFTLSIAMFVEILPLMFSKSVTQPIAGVKPYSSLQLAGRDVYIREGCYACHSQMIRPFRSETERYGHYSVAGESVYDRPFQWGSKRTGPDLARVGARYSDEWHRAHLMNPRDVVPESNMPAFAFLATKPVNAELMTKKLQTLRDLGEPYTDADIAGAADAVKGKTEMDALIAYLQGLGLALKNKR
ncbi:cytochrome-c oxidase, cbb3-type subunit II [Deefgea piscis]|uniref:Cytochrome-c oxidase, cbb3-type subunit II n=1 Tax=Deefgea piscis TaxID=2739061 RepID=A0A6M8T0J6_9NEIS|nr:cytochrome-c oxidase, cbb3-type subunit II [Deefgea piscis]QKJ67527.1 cytochrome-c oxidase, cbb3-type subunit II [Deefgea piscis]